MMNSGQKIAETFLKGEETFTGHFSGEVRKVSLMPFTKADYSSTTGVFPGQGVSFEGKFAELLKTCPRVRDYFQQADAFALAKSWLRPTLYLTSPQRLNAQSKAKVKNLALFTLEVALFEELKQQGFLFRRVAGYSFGEYAAWTAAGVISFAQMLEVIYWREELTPEPNVAGASVLIGASVEKIKELLPQFTYFVANRNLPDQTIITTKSDVADALVKFLLKERVLCKKLAELGQPYHSSLMTETANALEQKIAQMTLELGPPRFPIYSSVVSRWIDAESFNRKEFQQILSKQLTEPVDFLKFEAALEGEGRHSVLELGPGTSCSDLLKKLGPPDAFRYLPLTNYFRSEVVQRKEFDEKVRKSRFVGVVSKVVSRLTGYEVEDIVIEDRFQEDLGIDSLKKAELLFEVLQEAKINIDGDVNTSRFKSLGDLVEYFENGGGEQRGERLSEVYKAPFERFVSGWGPQNANLRLPQTDSFREVVTPFEQVCDLSSRRALLEKVQDKTDTPTLLTIECFDTKTQPSVETWSRFTQFWREFFNAAPDSVFNIICLGITGAPIYEGCRSFLRSVSKENRHVVVLSVAVEGEKQRPSSDLLWKQIQRPQLAERKIVGKEILERQWSRAPLHAASGAAFEPRKMVWFGGAGGIAFELLNRFPQKAEAELHLVGRRPLGDLTVQDRLSMFELEYASVHYHCVDAGNAQAVDLLLTKINSHGAPIDLVVNSTGVDRSAPLKVKVDAEIEEELQQKLAPSTNLLNWCRKNPDVYQVHFSSVVGPFGNANQTVYGLANASLGANVVATDPRALVIHWPPWSNVGMTSQSAVRMVLLESGVPLLMPEEASKFFWADVGARTSGDLTYVSESYYHREQLRHLNVTGISSFMGELPQHADRHILAKWFNLKTDAYLLDHRIQEKNCVPAATAITMFLQLAALVDGQYQPLYDFAMLNMLIVDADGIHCGLSGWMNPGGVQFQLRSLMTHAHASMLSSPKIEDQKIATLFTEPIQATATKNTIPMQSFYKSNVLFHGPTLQVLGDTWQLSKKSFRGRIERKKLVSLQDNEFFDSLMPTIDGIFQLLVVGNYLDSKIKALPTAVKFIKLNGETTWTENFWVQIEIHAAEAGAIQGSGVIFNDRSEIIAELRGITAQDGVAAFSPKTVSGSL